MYRPLLASLIAAPLLAACVSVESTTPAASAEAAPTCRAMAPAEFEAQFKRFNDAWQTKDPKKVTALFSPDAVLLATVSNTPRTTPAEVEDYFVKFLKGSPIGTINSSTIKSDCNTASSVGTWTVSLADATTGVRSDVKARYSFIYSYEDGDWKIEHLHSSMMPEK